MQPHYHLICTVGKICIMEINWGQSFGVLPSIKTSDTLTMLQCYLGCGLVNCFLADYCTVKLQKTYILFPTQEYHRLLILVEQTVTV